MSGSRARPPSAGASMAPGRIGIHFTPAANLEGISQHGLLPSVGPLSKLAGEEQPLVHLFSPSQAIEADLSPWMGDMLSSSGGHAVATLAVELIDLPLRRASTGLSIGHRIDSWRIEILFDGTEADTPDPEELQLALEDLGVNRESCQVLNHLDEHAWRQIGMRRRFELMREAEQLRRTYIQRNGRYVGRADVAQMSMFPTVNLSPPRSRSRG